jgi:acetyl esterase/lipase
MEIRKQKKRMVIIILTVLVAVFAVGGIITAIQLGQMNKLNATACNTSYGQNRLDELKSQGISVTRTIYSDDEIKTDPAKTLVKLYCFPNPQKQKSRFIIVCPGGAYSECALSVEGYPPAAQLNELGYTAFVLEYRVGKNGGDFAAVDDLAAAIKYITERADEFNVEPENYALLGCSAGGNLVGLFGTEKNGYRKYGVQKPSVIFMGYPWCNPNIKSINPAKIIMYAILNFRGYKGLIGKGAAAAEKQQMRIPWQVTENYPPCYIMHGTNDIIVPIGTHSDVLAEALEKNGVLFSYERADGVNHGCGIGTGTTAENWLSGAVTFWEERVLSGNLSK